MRAEDTNTLTIGRPEAISNLGEGPVPTSAGPIYLGASTTASVESSAQVPYFAPESLYYSMQGQVIEERSPFINPSTGAVTMVTSDQYIWGAGYVNDLILRDRNTDGLTTTGNEGGTGSGLDERIYALYDANWDITAITDTGGNVLEQFVYSPYGVQTVVTPAGNHLMADGYNWVYGFQGERTDPITGEVESASREEDPTTGTWNEQDPAGYVNGANTYQFVGDDPAGRIDPGGLDFDTWGGFGMNYGGIGNEQPTQSSIGERIGEIIGWRIAKAITILGWGHNWGQYLTGTDTYQLG